jgi:hypothetical protein
MLEPRPLATLGASTTCNMDIFTFYLNNIRLETSRSFRNKKRAYLKDKIDEIATNSKHKNIRDQYRE